MARGIIVFFNRASVIEVFFEFNNHNSLWQNNFSQKIAVV